MMAGISSMHAFSLRPEIEDPKQFGAALYSDEHFCASPSFDLLDSGYDRPRWIRSPSDADLRNNLECDTADCKRAPRTRVFFLKTERQRRNEKRLRMPAYSFQILIEKFRIPRTFVEGVFKDMIWDGNGCFLSQNSDGHPEKFELFYRNECGWFQTVQTAFVADFASNTATYLIIDCPESAKERIKHGIEHDSNLFGRPLALDALLFDECLKAWKDRVDHYRSKLLAYERQSPKDDQHASSEDSDIESATNRLHKLCTKTHRMFEHLADLDGCGKFLRDAHRRYVDAIRERNENKDNAWPLDGSDSVKDSLTQVLSGVDYCKRWTKNYMSRTTLYENMLWHADVQNSNEINERNAVVNLRNAEVNLRISRLTKEDSKSMIALSVLAMLFLPGTFVAGIFSMAFFSSPTTDDFEGSKWIWIYFALTIPLTAGSFVAWSIWKRRGTKAGRSISWDSEQGPEIDDIPLRGQRSRLS